MDKPPSRIKSLRLPNEPFLQSNGYKPAPLDLGAITLTPKMEELVDQLAENTHNLWAKERIQQGWTYGLNEVINCLSIYCDVLVIFIILMYLRILKT
jgi:ryanodine receptor 2